MTDSELKMSEEEGEQGEQMKQREESAERRRRRRRGGRPHHEESVVGKKIQESKLDSWQYHIMVVISLLVQSANPTEALWYLILGYISNIDLACGQGTVFCDSAHTHTQVHW